VTQIPTRSGGAVNPTGGRAAPGTIIGGRYSLKAAVGHGGMGTVWRAADTLLRRDVAVKEVILPPGLATSDRDAMYERTLREARAAAALQHPAVVQVYDVVTEGGRPWIVMELLDARSLADMVIEDGPLAPRAVAKIGIALLGALEVAHAVGVLHRDVKPANVLICTDGRCVLTDFGVARMPTDAQLTTPGMVLGSPHFISPERAMGQEFGPPSDLFSLGVTLYTAVEGRPPFDRGDPIETMHAVVEDPPAPPTRSGPLTPVLMGLLEKDPARRLDAYTARTTLRELLAGPLASKPAGHNLTDPYAVVTPTRTPWQAPPSTTATAPAAPAAPGQPSGQVGGRAMLGPHESLADRLATRGQPGQSRPAASDALQVPTGAMAPPAGAIDPIEAPTGIMGSQSAPAGSTPVPPPLDAETARWRPIASPAPATSEAYPGGAGHYPGGGDHLGAIARWPRKLLLAAGGGLAAVLLIGVIVLTNGADPDPGGPPVTAPTTPAGPTFETQVHTGRGVSVNVPKGWEKSGAGVWIDFSDPEVATRKVRILVEKAGASTQPLPFLRSAGERLAKNRDACAGYRQIALIEVEVAGRPSAELEYTCGSGEKMRHGVWRAVVENRKVYSFYLTTPESVFEESKPVFDEMVRSFQLTGTD
jgi:serine/threonine protein kinase